MSEKTTNAGIEYLESILESHYPGHLLLLLGLSSRERNYLKGKDNADTRTKRNALSWKLNGFQACEQGDPGIVFQQES